MLRIFVLIAAGSTLLAHSGDLALDQKKAETKERMKYLMDMKYLIPPKDSERIEIKLGKDEELPDKFDARDRWPECRHLISTVRDQTKVMLGSFGRFNHDR
ncbi:unnamed protein product [Strongylus vulgaris]|uniref:Uncharacterized protein n=1 Tax=Strongylus vulgaris TaxID=40348 RepID=A0A3P7L4R0_STRVU|nr:unnamed protein product [Strongylus vulgaris]